MAEYWIDNSRENEDMTAMGTGTKQDPFNMVSSVEKIIVPGSAHTVHLEGTNKPYKGGFGGKGLKRWIFRNCTIVKHETIDKKVTFSATRTLPISALTGDPVRDARLFRRLRMEGKRLYRDGDNLVLTNPFQLGRHHRKGFIFTRAVRDEDGNIVEPARLEIDPDRIATKAEHRARREELRALKGTV